MASWSDQDIRVNGTSIMTKAFWVSDRDGFDMTPPLRSTNFEVAYLQGTMFERKQIAEVARTITMTVDACDEDGAYPVGRVNRMALLNSNMRELFALFGQEGAQVAIERDVLLSDGIGGSELETWTGYAQVVTSMPPEFDEDFDHMRITFDLLFADPVWYGDTVTQEISGTEVMNNPGSIEATNMILEFTGGSNYRLTNETLMPEDFWWFQVDHEGDVTVDVRAGTVVNDVGETLIGFISKNRTIPFFRLLPGDNDLVLTSGSVTITFDTPRG